MSAAVQEPGLPRPVIIGAIALIALSVAAAGLGLEARRTARPDAAPGVAEIRAILFVDREDGGVEVIEAGQAAPLAVLAPGTNGFVRGALRGLVRERKRRLVGPEEPFHLVRRTDGRLVLEDRATSASIDLGAFGPSNLEPFVSLMNLKRGQP